MRHDVPPSIAAAAADGASTLARAWILQPASGPSVGFTDHDRDLIVDSVDCRAMASFDPGQIEAALGAGIDQAGFRLSFPDEAAFAADLASGRYDGAEARHFLVNWARAGDDLLLWRGRLGAVRRGAHGFEAELVSLKAGLEHIVGRVYRRDCSAQLGDEACRIDLADPHYRGEGRTLALDGPAAVTVAGLEAFAPVWFAGGALTWLRGANIGQSQSVIADIGAAATRRLVLGVTPFNPIAIGDRFEIVAGCDKRAATCRDKFANILNFQGFPHLPGDNVLLAGPEAESRRDGSSRFL